MNDRYKLVFVPGSPFQPSLMLVRKAGVYLLVKQHTGAVFGLTCKHLTKLEMIAIENTLACNKHL